jgi:hypothetical protein
MRGDALPVATAPPPPARPACGPDALAAFDGLATPRLDRCGAPRDALVAGALGPAPCARLAAPPPRVQALIRELFDDEPHFEPRLVLADASVRTAAAVPAVAVAAAGWDIDASIFAPRKFSEPNDARGYANGGELVDRRFEKDWRRVRGVQRFDRLVAGDGDGDAAESNVRAAARRHFGLIYGAFLFYCAADGDMTDGAPARRPCDARFWQRRRRWHGRLRGAREPVH